MSIQPRAPQPEGLNLEFYEHAASGTLHIQQCSDCGHFRHPPRYFCPVCFSSHYRWTPSEGRGTLFSWTVTHFPYDRGWAEGLPYATLVVELDEGVRLIGADGTQDIAVLSPGLRMVGQLTQDSYGFPFLTFVEHP
ncbi:Zn-ribbon domain-containing OB-fold protein [Conexibacter sp. DBS9H8]|uniref:Zn-ribbon domain-containing OB-fold protein n=1 Tax=Conexibacter sp. DBS9H8 TaxID=2937801 RepID=UPI00200D6417|nr:OB-fold domain-containing protein [Conexibacter sp. DBS9H8]